MLRFHGGRTPAWTPRPSGAILCWRGFARSFWCSPVWVPASDSGARRLPLPALAPAMALSYRAEHLEAAFRSGDPAAIQSAVQEVELLRRTYGTLDVLPLVDAMAVFARDLGREGNPDLGLQVVQTAEAWAPADPTLLGTKVILMRQQGLHGYLWSIADVMELTRARLVDPVHRWLVGPAAPGLGAAHGHPHALGLGPEPGPALPPGVPPPLGGAPGPLADAPARGGLPGRLPGHPAGDPGPGSQRGRHALAVAAGPVHAAHGGPGHRVHRAAAAGAPGPGWSGAPGHRPAPAQHRGPAAAAPAPA